MMVAVANPTFVGSGKVRNRMPNRRKRRSRGRGDAQKSGRAGRGRNRNPPLEVARIREKGAEAGVPAFSSWHAGAPIGKSNPAKGHPPSPAILPSSGAAQGVGVGLRGAMKALRLALGLIVPGRPGHQLSPLLDQAPCQSVGPHPLDFDHRRVREPSTGPEHARQARMVSPRAGGQEFRLRPPYKGAARRQSEPIYPLER